MNAVFIVSDPFTCRFFESPELVELRREAGVKAPDFIYLEEIERGVL